MIRRPPRSTRKESSAASDVYKRQGSDIYSEEMDIYAPCALGATVNDESIHKLKAQVIAGAANNQLKDEIKHGAMLRDCGIAYAPDFLINAGGIINVYAELEGYGKAEILSLIHISEPTRRS